MFKNNCPNDRHKTGQKFYTFWPRDKNYHQKDYQDCPVEKHLSSKPNHNQNRSHGENKDNSGR